MARLAILLFLRACAPYCVGYFVVQMVICKCGVSYLRFGILLFMIESKLATPSPVSSHMFIYNMWMLRCISVTEYATCARFA